MPLPGCPTRRKETECPLYRRLGGSQGLSRWMQKISSPPGFHSWIIQPVDAILAHNRQIHPNDNKIVMCYAHIVVRTYNDTTTTLSLTT